MQSKVPFLVVLALSVVAISAPARGEVVAAEEPAAHAPYESDAEPANIDSLWRAASTSRARFQDEGEYGAAGGEEEEGGISDNSFFVEEAYNQEPGIVQHIFNYIPTWDHTDGKTRNAFFIFTQEWPIGSQRHQFSYTLPFSNFREEPDGGPAVDENGMGDMLLNYRYQLYDGSDGGVAIAPRFSVVLPTGNEERDLGNGVTGYQLNLPVSYQGCCHAYHFNAGMTIAPNVEAPLGGGAVSPPRDLVGYFLGGSIIWTHSNTVQPMLELVALWDEEIDEIGVDDSGLSVILSPGVRWAPITRGDTQLVLGAAVPVGLSDDAPDIGVFGYLSFEHRFRRE